jgi:hypothetical protein
VRQTFPLTLFEPVLFVRRCSTHTGMIRQKRIDHRRANEREDTTVALPGQQVRIPNHSRILVRRGRKIDCSRNRTIGLLLGVFSDHAACGEPSAWILGSRALRGGRIPRRNMRRSPSGQEGGLGLNHRGASTRFVGGSFSSSEPIHQGKRKTAPPPPTTSGKRGCSMRWIDPSRPLGAGAGPRPVPQPFTSSGKRRASRGIATPA